MNTEQVLIRLPTELARRFRQTIPMRQRSSFVADLLDRALPTDPEADPLYQAARVVEQDQRLMAEMAEWDEATVADGLDAMPPVHEK